MSDEIPTSVAVGDKDGKVLLQFSKPTQNLVMDPENARQIAEGIARAAYTCHYGKPPAGSTSIINQDIQTRLISRLTLVIRSLQDKGKQPGYIAAEVLDIVLREVT